MKITKIETFVCHARMRNWVFVKVLTDEPGLYGWGEATLEWHTRAVVGAIEDVAPLIVGEDPADAARFADLAQKAVEEGFTAFKSMAVPETMPLEGLRPIRYAEACVR